MWRPDNWEYQKKTIIDIDAHPEKTWDVAHSCGWADGYEAGADAILEAIWKLAEESPTKTFFFDANIQRAYARVFDRKVNQ